MVSSFQYMSYIVCLAAHSIYGQLDRCKECSVIYRLRTASPLQERNSFPVEELARVPPEALGTSPKTWFPKRADSPIRRRCSRTLSLSVRLCLYTSLQWHSQLCFRLRGPPLMDVGQVEQCFFFALGALFCVCVAGDSTRKNIGVYAFTHCRLNWFRSCQHKSLNYHASRVVLPLSV